MSTTLTNDQITAGAAVLGDNGQPIGRNTAIMAFDAMTTAAPDLPLGERQRTGLMANTERKRDYLEQRGYGVIGYVMQGARGDRCTVAHGAVNWLAEQRSVADMIRTPMTAADFSPDSAEAGRKLMDAWNADAKTLGAQAAMRECPDCDGTGRISSKELCARCDHSGILPARAAQPDGDQGAGR